MTLQILLYIGCILLFIYSGISLFHKYRNSSGIFFLSFIIFLLAWILLASISFNSNLDIDDLILINQLSHWSSFTLFNSICFFFLFFKANKSLVKQAFVNFFIISSIFLYFFVHTKLIISGVEFNRESGIYREVYGAGFFFLQLFYSAILVVLGCIAFRTIKKQDYITKIRLIYIIIGFILTATIAILLLIIFPLFNIYLYEGEIIYCFIPFLIGIIYSSQNYVFSSFRGIFIKLIFFLIAIVGSLWVIYWVKHLAIIFGAKNLTTDWSDMKPLDFVFYTFLFLTISHFFDSWFKMGNTFFTPLGEIQKKIPFSTTLDDLNFLLHEEFKKYFSIHYVHINIYEKQTDAKDTISYTYFKSGKSRGFFLNDQVFIQENLLRSDNKVLIKNISKEVYLVIPLYKKELLVGDISFGKKSFNSYYSKEEVDTLKDFTHFIEGHLKYIDIYQEIHDLNLNLEKRVDDKTIQYNSIINRQKEFIEVVSHEVRTPLASALFQTECLEDDIEALDFVKKRKILKEVRTLYSKIVDTVSLVNKLFSIERFESNKIHLYKETTDLSKLIKSQLDSYRTSHRDILFSFESSQNIPNLEIDVVQFRQVIDNLLTNAIKFTKGQKNLKISLALVKKKNDIIFTIEDSGLGFSGVDMENIFQKYSTGNSSSIGLGMGLYLCKKIVELHGGSIGAAKSHKLGGALFHITIPLLPA